MNLQQFTMPLLDGREHALAEHEGKVLLIVNTASQCGFTPQYQGLEQLYQQFRDEGFVILGFPCNQFKGQEPDSNDEIASFCEKNYGVSFPMFSKIEVNGENTAPLYQILKKEAPGLLGSQGIKWNFTKFLVGRDGKVIRRYSPTTKPEAIRSDIQKALERRTQDQ